MPDCPPPFPPPKRRLLQRICLDLTPRTVHHCIILDLEIALLPPLDILLPLGPCCRPRHVTSIRTRLHSISSLVILFCAAQAGVSGERGEGWTAAQIGILLFVIFGNLPILGGSLEIIAGPGLLLAGAGLAGASEFVLLFVRFFFSIVSRSIYTVFLFPSPFLPSSLPILVSMSVLVEDRSR